jgi:hypothetical protein
MRVKVRAVRPPADDAGLEEIVAATTDAGPGGAGPRPTPDPGSRGPGAADGNASSAPAAFRLETHERPISAADLGPNGDVVLDLLSRASRLTPAERRSLDREAGWRWWLMSPLPGTGMLGARATAVARARAGGRADAVAALDRAVAGILPRLEGPKTGRSRLRACISNAGLAVLARDLVEPETFETLFGPWREVMHH